MKATHFALAVSLGISASAQAAVRCTEGAHTNVEALLACIREPDLWRYLSQFQVIADANPNREGHPNRNTGTQGYKDSVDYVAKLMRGAGYHVAVQSYIVKGFETEGTPSLSAGGHDFAAGKDWFVARLSGAGTVSAAVQPVGRLSGTANGGAASGCDSTDFAGFKSGTIALMQHGECDFDTAVANAQAAGAAGAIIYNSRDSLARGGRGTGGGRAYEAHLGVSAHIPVAGVVSYAAGAGLFRAYMAGHAPYARLDIKTQPARDVTDYNLIADSPFGDRNHVVVAEGHLDAIYGAGILDNGSGSATLVDVALNMAQTPTRNQLRYIWFGGEEIGLFGSKYYTRNLPPAELHRIVFDIDADVTATPNFAILVAAAKNAHDAKRFPPNVVPGSRVGNRYFLDYFGRIGIAAQLAGFGNDGTDSHSFSVVGVPNTGILTQQDCCKSEGEVNVWGGFTGNYEGDIPSHNGGCVDQPHRWCDNLSNNDPFVLEFVSKAVGYVTYRLANDPSL
jgi:hypothetical protein